MLSIGEMENAVRENLILVFDDMDQTHVVQPSLDLPAVMAGRDMASVRDLDRPIVHLQSLYLSRKNLKNNNNVPSVFLFIRIYKGV